MRKFNSPRSADNRDERLASLERNEAKNQLNEGMKVELEALRDGKSSRMARLLGSEANGQLNEGTKAELKALRDGTGSEIAKLLGLEANQQQLSDGQRAKLDAFRAED